MDRTTDFYFNTVGPNAPVYNGSAYAGYGQKIGGSPFFGNDRLAPGVLFYDGVLYKDLPMAYDMVGDFVIIKDYRHENLLIKLVGEKINYFIINDHFFISSGEASNEGSGGFFDRLYNGKHTILAKRRKLIQDRPLDEKEKSAFVEYNSFYIKKEDGFVPANSLPALLSVFADKKTSVKKHLREQRLNIKKEPEKTIIEAARYYDSLAN